MGDCLATMDMGLKEGAAVPLSEEGENMHDMGEQLDPHQKQCGLG